MCMIKKPVKKTLSLSDYLKNLDDEDIREDQEVQRAAGKYSAEMNNELVFTILTDDYVPPIILGQDLEGFTYIIDGLQRTTCFKLFKSGIHKITPKIKDSIVHYKERVTHDDGTSFMEEVECDIKGLTYQTLPKELKKKFDEYQVEMVIHEDCTHKRLSELVCRYNNHKNMTPAEKAFTRLDEYALKVRKILDKPFFVECSGYTENEKNNGVMQRVITESVMCINYLDKWKKDPNSICTFLNVNACEDDFNHFEEMIERLGGIIAPVFKEFFTSKNSFIWFTIFNKFLKYGLDDCRFVDFLNAVSTNLHTKTVEISYKGLKAITYDKLNTESNTKDKVLINVKLELLEKLMLEYFHISENNMTDEIIPTFNFVKEYVSSDITEEDIEFYEELLEDLSLNVINDTKLLDKQNHNSLIGIVAYSVKTDTDLDNWFTDYFRRTNTYCYDQQRNYIAMKNDFDKYITQEKVSAERG